MNKVKQTKRSFYGKWFYKISLSLEGSFILRNKELCEISSYISSMEGKTYNTYSSNYKILKSKDNLIRIADFLSAYPKDLYGMRSETGIIDFYTSDKTFYEHLIDEFKDIVRICYQPDTENLDVLKEKKNIIVKKLPHDRYRYKIFLLPHKIKDDTQKESFLSWIETQDGKITLTPAVKEWFMATRWNWDRRYVLVEDEKTLLMLKLRSPEAVGSIYDYVISDK